MSLYSKAGISRTLISVGSILVCVLALGRGTRGQQIRIDEEAMKGLLGGRVHAASKVSVDAYLSAIDGYVVKALDAGISITMVNNELSKLTTLDETAPSPSYRIIEEITSAGPVYFAVYQLSGAGPSSLRVYGKKGARYTMLFAFSPTSEMNHVLEEPVEVLTYEERGGSLPFVTILGGSTSGFAPPFSLVAWSLDLKSLAVDQNLTVLHKRGLSILPMSKGSHRLVIRWCEYRGDPSDCDTMSEMWYDSSSSFRVVATYVVKTVYPERE